MIGNTNASIIIGETQPEQTTGDYLVRYIDLDGTILKEQWVNDGEDATPPSNPSFDNTRLTFNSWNQVSTNITSNKDIGAIYDTVANKTYAKIRLTTVSGLSPTLYLWKSDDSTLTIDWGDSTQSTFTNTGNFNTGTHTYSTVGDYWITMWISSGSGNYRVGSGANSTVFVGGATQVYKNTLLSVYLDHNNLTVFDNAFYGCFSLTNISIPSSVTSIGDNIFNSCYSLENISIPSSVTSIGIGEFSSCYSLKNISIPSSVTSIGGNAFYACYSLTNISIPSSVTSIGDNIFNSCYSLENISIPTSVTSIGISAFFSCYSLKNTSIPSSVTGIGGSAFYGCYSLTNISIPSSVTSIGATAFYGCYSLTNISIPSSVTSIGGSLFQLCFSLTNISIPSSVTSIGSNAFSSCFSILKYKCYRTTPPTLSSSNAFAAINSICKIYVPDESVTAYKTATNWSTYAKYIYPLSEIGE